MADSSRTLPSLDLLKGFESAARQLNFTRAADELHLTQSAVSRQVQALEERLRVRLFLRQRRGLVLTQEGERLYRAVHGALQQVREAVDSLAERNQGQRITVTSPMAFCSLWLIPRLGEFHRSCPEVDVRIAASDRVLDLERERIDVSIRYRPTQAVPKEWVRLFDEELMPVCAPALIARTGKLLRRPEDLAHYVLLHIDDPDNPAPWMSWAQWLDAVGVGRLKPAGSLAFNYTEQLIRAALAGQGVALGRLPLVRDLLRDGSLVAPFAERAPVDRAYFLLEADFARGRPEVTRFTQWVIEAARADVATPLTPRPKTGRTPRRLSATMQAKRKHSGPRARAAREKSK